ncbi:sodium-coupled monocarboxylate transporter 1-like [Ptychodera flava]|uniref:sodium-coupled monocarboxylate transporter 1-like n=1 Tax=Ptychodera flava TaxID=63121 RepID=UPI00396A865B
MSGEVIPFGALDYVVFAALLVVSASTGVYHALVKGGQRTTSRYLLADSGMKGIPVAMSMAVSFLSPITILGGPAEIYGHGITYIFHAFSCLWIFPVVAFLFVPVFYGLKLKTSYEYLDLRFNYPLRLFASALFVLQQAFYMAICLLGPALAFGAVQGFALWKGLVITGIVCTFYTVIGGLKAVIWVDVFQCLVMIVSVITFLVLGTVKAGGPTFVWDYNVVHGRLDVDFSFDPTARMTFMNTLFGTGMLFLSFTVGQTSVQRYASTKSLKQAKLSALFNIPLWFFFMFCFNLTGFVLFAFYNDIPSVLEPAINATFPPDIWGNSSFGYANVDPRYSPNYGSPDQILVYFVSSQLGRIQGIQGLFIACVTAGTLSSVSSSINAMTSVTLQDFIKPFREWRARRDQLKNEAGHITQSNDARDTLLSKIMSCIYGLSGIGLAYLASSLGTLITVAVILAGTTGGPMTAPFLTGMLYKRANGSGMLVGSVAGFCFGLWVAIGSFVYRDVIHEVWALYRISSMWYTMFTCLVAIIVGVIASEIFRLFNKHEREAVIDPSLLATCLRPKNWQPVPDEPKLLNEPLEKKGEVPLAKEEETFL